MSRSLINELKSFDLIKGRYISTLIYYIQKTALTNSHFAGDL